MALTPVVFLELATPSVALPCQDPFFVAIRLTKRFVAKLQTLELLCRQHRLSIIVFDGRGQPLEFADTTLVEPTAELHVVGEQLLVSVWGRRWNEQGQLGKIEHVADSWFIDVADLVRAHDAGTPVTLHSWDDWDDPDLDLDPFGVRVLRSLRGAGTLPRYQRQEWFDPDVARMLEELQRPGAKRVRRPVQRRTG